MKFLTGTTIAMLLSVTAAPAIMAEPSVKTPTLIGQSEGQDPRPDWEVQSVEDGQLMVRMKGGTMTQTFMISSDAVQSLNLRPGSTIELNYDNVMVGTVASATQTNIDVDFDDRERITYTIPESGNDYDLSDEVVVTPERILGKVAEWELSAADVTVLNPVSTTTSTVTQTSVQPDMPSATSTSALSQTEVEVEDDSDIEETDNEATAVPGLW